MFDFIKEGYKERDKVWNVMTQGWEIIVIVNLNKECPIVTDEGSYTSEGYEGLRHSQSIPNIYPNKFDLSVPNEAYEIPPKDKDFVECWDEIEPFRRVLRFYDAKNNCTFRGRDGCRNSFVYDNYKKIPIPDWAKAIKYRLDD